MNGSEGSILNNIILQIDCAAHDLEALAAEIAFQRDRVNIENARLQRFGEHYVSDVGRTVSSVTSSSVRDINTLLGQTLGNIEV